MYFLMLFIVNVTVTCQPIQCVWQPESYAWH